jgi:hypothetical protein
MRRAGWRQRSDARKPFTLSVVDRRAPKAAERRKRRGRPRAEVKHRSIAKFIRTVQSICPAVKNQEIFDFLRQYVEASDPLIYDILERFEDDGATLDIKSDAFRWLSDFLLAREGDFEVSPYRLKPGERLPNFVKMLQTDKVVLERGEVRLEEGKRYAVKTPLMRSYVQIGLRERWLEPCKPTKDTNFLE